MADPEREDTSGKGALTLSAFLWVPIVAVIALGIGASFGPDLIASFNGPTMVAAPDAQSWNAVARIDQKIANSLTFLLFVVALLPFLFAYLERLRMQEIDRFRDELQVALQSMLTKVDAIDKASTARIDTAEVNISDRIQDQVRSEFRTLEDRYLDEVGRLVTRKVTDEAKRQSTFISESEATAGLFLAAFIKNDLPKIPVERQIETVFNIQQATHRLMNLNPQDTLLAFVYLEKISEDLTETAALFLLQFLETVENQGRIRSLSNREKWDILVRKIEAKWGVERVQN